MTEGCNLGAQDFELGDHVSNPSGFLCCGPRSGSDYGDGPRRTCHTSLSSWSSRRGGHLVGNSNSARSSGRVRAASSQARNSASAICPCATRESTMAPARILRRVIPLNFAADSDLVSEGYLDALNLLRYMYLMRYADV